MADMLTELHRQLGPIASDVRRLRRWTVEHDKLHATEPIRRAQRAHLELQARWAMLIAALAALASLAQVLVMLAGR